MAAASDLAREFARVRPAGAVARCPRCDLAAAARGDRATRPIPTVRGYAIESWTGPDSLVLCCSYSGDTEETLACYEAAGALGAERVAVTSGGKLAEMAREDGNALIEIPGGQPPRP